VHTVLGRYCPHQTGRADLLASAFRHWSSVQSFSESYQPEFPEVDRQRRAFENSPRSLAASFVGATALEFSSSVED
jgi:hypothetical protein